MASISISFVVTGSLDLEKAVEWYKKAATQGMIAAQYAVGNAYYYGDGVPKDQIEGLAWLYLSNVDGAHPQICSVAENTLDPESVKKAKKRAADIRKQIEMRATPSSRN